MLSSDNVLRLVDSISILLSQAYQLARTRLASVASPVMRLLTQRDHVTSELELLRRELDILRAQRQNMSPHKRPDYQPAQRLAILQLRRLRGWNITKTAERFVLHPNTVREWINAVEGHGNIRLLLDAIPVWNRIDDIVRWAAHELHRLCPEQEFGSRTIARHLVRAGIAISRSTVQRVLRQEPTKPPRRRPPMSPRAQVAPHHLLTPQEPNRVWHMDLTSIRILWMRFTITAIIDGFSRKLLSLKGYRKTPRCRDTARLVHRTAQVLGKPRFIITDHGTQFRKQFHDSMSHRGVRHVKGRVRAPYLNGKVERLFRTFRIWWCLVLCGCNVRGIQRRLDDYRHWYNRHRPHGALGGLTPDEAWSGKARVRPIPIRSADPIKPGIHIHRARCRGDPRLPVIHITVRRAA